MYLQAPFGNKKKETVSSSFPHQQSLTINSELSHSHKTTRAKSKVTQSAVFSRHPNRQTNANG